MTAGLTREDNTSPRDTESSPSLSFGLLRSRASDTPSPAPPLSLTLLAHPDSSLSLSKSKKVFCGYPPKPRQQPTPHAMQFEILLES